MELGEEAMGYYITWSIIWLSIGGSVPEGPTFPFSFKANLPLQSFWINL